jgi:hypothetical protein
MMRVAQTRWREMVKIFGDAAQALPPAMVEGKRRLNEAERFHALLISEVDRLMDTWHAMERDRVPDGPTEHAA